MVLYEHKFTRFRYLELLRDVTFDFLEDLLLIDLLNNEDGAPSHKTSSVLKYIRETS